MVTCCFWCGIYRATSLICISQSWCIPQVSRIYIKLYSSEVRMTGDALRMRCRRMCERKASGRCNVDSEVAQQYKAGGEGRELLEMALLESIARHGLGRSSYKKIKAYIYNEHLQNTFFLKDYMVSLTLSVFRSNLEPFHAETSPLPLFIGQSDFITKCKLIRERLESRESETLGKWMTEEKLKKDPNYSKSSAQAIISYCKKFPESLVRPGVVLIEIWNFLEPIIDQIMFFDCDICLPIPLTLHADHGNTMIRSVSTTWSLKIGPCIRKLIPHVIKRKPIWMILGGFTGL